MTHCKWNGRTNPRTIPGRHSDDCPTPDTCAGCQPCTEPHCRICQVTHAPGTCAECLDETREALHDLARMCGTLPEEVEVRGIEGEAMFLLGPVADPEARGHLEASVLSGRVDWDAIEARHIRGCENPTCLGCVRELHPHAVVLSWQMVWRNALDHDDAPDSELTTAVDYLDRTMTYMAGYPHEPFEDFATEVRQLRSRMEAVIHDEPFGDQANVGCFDCGGRLERKLVDDGFEDFWTCRKCRRKYTYAEYNFALRAELEAQKDRKVEA